MTKEEAIQIIDSLDPAVMIKTTASNKQIREAIDMAVKALSKPSLPSDLDEAAEEALKKAYPADAYYYVGRTGRRLFKEGFKAGAEWMAGQGETFNGYISVKGKRSLIAIEGKSDIYKFGDEVVVQIRKK